MQAQMSLWSDAARQFFTGEAAVITVAKRLSCESGRPRLKSPSAMFSPTGLRQAPVSQPLSPMCSTEMVMLTR